VKEFVLELVRAIGAIGLLAATAWGVKMLGS
jgi:hypothetical protein